MKAAKNFYKGFKTGMTEFGHNIAIIINSSLLAGVYVIGVGATSIGAKLAGKKFLGANMPKGKGTHWTDLDLKKKDTEEYYRMF